MSLSALLLALSLLTSRQTEHRQGYPAHKAPPVHGLICDHSSVKYIRWGSQHALMRLVSTFLNFLLVCGILGAVKGVHHGQMQTAWIENGRKIAAALQTSPSFLHINDNLGTSNCKMNLTMGYFAHLTSLCNPLKICFCSFLQT